MTLVNFSDANTLCSKVMINHQLSALPKTKSIPGTVRKSKELFSLAHARLSPSQEPRRVISLLFEAG